MKKVKIILFIFIISIFIYIFYKQYDGFIDYNENNVELIERSKSKFQTIELVKSLSDDEDDEDDDEDDEEYDEEEEFDKYNYCLLLNEHIQNHSKEVYISHDAMINITISLCNINNIKEILILGGGDGYPAMFGLKYPNINITNIEIDNVLINFTKNNKVMKKLTNDALNDERLNLISKDAYNFIYNNYHKYDIIIYDIEHRFTKQNYDLSIKKERTFHMIENMLHDNSVLNFTDYIINDDIEILVEYYNNYINKNNDKYNILLFTTKDDFKFLNNCLKDNHIFDLNKIKKLYSNSEIGVMVYDVNHNCGEIYYGKEIYFYLCKNNLNKKNKDIKLYNFDINKFNEL